MKYRIKIAKLSEEETYFIPQYYLGDLGAVIFFPFYFLLSLVGGQILTLSDLLWNTIDVCESREEAKQAIRDFKGKVEFKTNISYEEVES
jgi:hypothetical protein